MLQWLPMLRPVAGALLLSLIMFAQTSRPELSTIADGETAFYSGMINGRFEIALTLTRSGGDLSGSYQYATQHKALDLRGALLPNGNLKITEYPASGVVTGEFLVEAVHGQTDLKGTWRSADGRLSYAVYLQKIDEHRYRELLGRWSVGQQAKSRGGPSEKEDLLIRLTSTDESIRNDAVREAHALDPTQQQQIISQLIQALANLSYAYYASQALGGLGEPAVSPLLQALHSSDARVRQRVSEALGRIGAPAREGVIAALNGPAPELQCAAARALGLMRGDAVPAVPALAALLRNHSIDVKRCVVTALGGIGSEEALSALRLELNDIPLQGETLNALAVMQKHASEATPEVLPLLKSDKPLVRMIAVRTLATIALPAPVVVAALSASLRDENRITRETAVVALGELGSAAAPAVPLIRDFLHDHSDTGNWVRSNAAEALGKIGPGAVDAVSDLISLWVDEFPYTRRNAVEAVSRIGPAAIPALLAALHDPNPEIRSGAAWQLGEFHAVEGTSLLIKALDDKDLTVQAAARSALEKIGTPEAKGALASAPAQPAPPALQTLTQIESPIPAAEGHRSPLKLVTETRLPGPGGITLLASVHRSDDRGDLVRIWKPMGDRFLLIREINAEADDPSVAAYQTPEGFRLSGEYFIHLMLLYSGTGFGHTDTFLWITPDATLHEIKFLSPAAQYPGLRQGEGVWKGESNAFHDNDASFAFGIWREGDANCCPSGGRVEGHYQLIGHSNYSPNTKEWSSDFQIVPADFTRLAKDPR